MTAYFLICMSRDGQRQKAERKTEKDAFAKEETKKCVFMINFWH